MHFAPTPDDPSTICLGCGGNPPVKAGDVLCRTCGTVTDEPDRIGVRLTRGDARVEWVDLGEGESGDYNDADPQDTEYLRVDTYYCGNGELEWMACDSGSYCTRVPVATSLEVRQARLVQLMDELHDAIVANQVKRAAARMSWINAAGDLG